MSFDEETLKAKIAPMMQEVAQQLMARKWMLATAESCTGGWVSKICTDYAGSSRWFDCSILCYSNRSKQHFLDVQHMTMERHGVVSEAVVNEMVQGLLLRTQCGAGVAISGIAGPDGGTEKKPVGTVCFAWRTMSGTQYSCTERFLGDRASVRLRSVYYALSGVHKILLKEV